MVNELISHFMMFIVLIFFIVKLWHCLRLGKVNFDSDWATADDKFHLLDHLMGALLSVFGAGCTAVLLFIEMITHLTETPSQLHVAINISLCITLAGAAYIAWHIEREESPTHPFFHWRKK